LFYFCSAIFVSLAGVGLRSEIFGMNSSAVRGEAGGRSTIAPPGLAGLNRRTRTPANGRVTDSERIYNGKNGGIRPRERI
jgi:hypothetical protein